MIRWRTGAVMLAFLSLPASAWAQDAGSDDQPTKLPEVVVHGRAEDLLGTANTASQGAVGAVDLEDLPLLRRGELLETVPGLVVTQHSGDGKANQYFLRGFNLDHGTDFAFSVDGVPVNLRTHAHGQGYSDLNFMIPELVDSIEYKKGPFYAEVGDFSGAGAADLHYVNRLPEAILDGEVGLYGFVRALAADSVTEGNSTLLYAVEYNHYDGPWDLHEASNRFNGFLRYHLAAGRDQYTVTGNIYAAPGWRSTDQVPERSIDSGMIDRFGAIDPSDGGNTGRGSLTLDWQRHDEGTDTRATLYGSYYRLNLFSNFTYFLDDPVHGDQFEQIDERLVAGGELQRTWHGHLGAHPMTNTAGLQLRNDYIPTVELNHTENRSLLDIRSKDRVEEFSVALYAQNQIQWTSWFKTIVGLRADVYALDVTSDTAANSGNASSGIVNPKASLVFGPWAKTELYASFGTGFHSNDARGVTITVAPHTTDPLDPAALLVRTTGAEVGTRTSILPGLVATASLWYLHSDSELTFAGDAGDTQSNLPSEKYGFELATFYKPTHWLTLTGDVALTHARFIDDPPRQPATEPPDRGYIANSIPMVVSGVATVEAPYGFYGSARLRFFSAQPLNSNDSVEEGASTTVDAKLGYRHAWYEAAVEVLNLFDAKDNDIAYAYVSRLQGEPAAGVDGRHVHPNEPFEARLSLIAHY